MTNVHEAGNLPQPCPSWCTTDHPRHDPLSRFISDDGHTVLNERHHTADVAAIPNPEAGAGRQVHVMLLQVDELDDERRLPVAINVDGAECLRPEAALELARALVVAAEVAATGAGCSRRHGSECVRVEYRDGRETHWTAAGEVWGQYPWPEIPPATAAAANRVLEHAELGDEPTAELGRLIPPYPFGGE